MEGAVVNDEVLENCLMFLCSRAMQIAEHADTEQGGQQRSCNYMIQARNISAISALQNFLKRGIQISDIDKQGCVLRN